MSKMVKFLVELAGVQHEVSTAKEVGKLLGKRVTRTQITNGELPEVTVIDPESDEETTSTAPVEETTEIPVAEIKEDTTEEVVEETDSIKEEVEENTRLEEINEEDTKAEEIEEEIEENKEEKNMKGFGTVQIGDTVLELNDPLNRGGNEAAISDIDSKVIEQVEEILNQGADEEDKETLEDYVEENMEPDTCSICGKEFLPEEDTYTLDSGELVCKDCNDQNIEEDSNESDTDKKPNIEQLMQQMRELNAKKNPSTSKGAKGKGSNKIDAQKYLEEHNGFPEIGEFKEEKGLKKFYKQLSDEQLDEWLDTEGLSYKPSDNPPINRMRKCMAILYLHFPRENKGTGKSKSKYAEYSTEELLQIALDKNIPVKDSKGDPRILRMYTVMALKEAGELK